MSATHGLARAALAQPASRTRLVAVFALSAVLASTASAVNPIKETYLALGDSLAFGYSQQLFNENLVNGEPADSIRTRVHQRLLARTVT